MSFRKQHREDTSLKTIYSSDIMMILSSVFENNDQTLDINSTEFRKNIPDSLLLLGFVFFIHAMNITVTKE